MESQYVETKANGTVYPRKGNPRRLYEHQSDAVQNMGIIDKHKNYSTLIVLPTGRGKTYTAAYWLLSNALDKRKKILWIAHRQTLLDQAAEAFQNNAYFSLISHISSFRFRIKCPISQFCRLTGWKIRYFNG